MDAKNVIQEDWSQREFVTKMHFGIQKIVSFLNRFEDEARFKLARVNEQLTRLERNCDFVEAILRHSDPSTRGAKPSSIQGTVFDSAWRAKEENRRRRKWQEQRKPIVKKISSSVKGRILKAGMQSEMKEQRFQSSAPTAEMKQPIAQPIAETKREEKSERLVAEKPSGEDAKGKPDVQVKPMKTPPTTEKPGDQVLPPPQPVATPLPPPGPPGGPPPGPPAAPPSGPPVVVPPGAPSGPPQAGPPQAPPVGPPGVQQAPPPIPQPGANMTGPPALPPPGPPPGPGASSSGPGAPPPGPGAPPGPGVPPVPFSGPPTRPPPQPMPGVPAETDVKSEDEEESSYEDPPIKEFRPPIPADHDDIWIQRVSPGNNSKPGPLVNSYLTIEYTGWIKNSGECFDQIDDFGLQMGSGDNIVGLEKILLKMREGETILAYIPSHLAYGEEGGGDVIPPNSDLVFDLTLNSIN